MLRPYSENCTVEPGILRPKLPSGESISQDDLEGSKGVDSTAQVFSKIVDYSIALELPWYEQDLIDEVYNTLRAGERSVNQSLSYICNCPLVADIELKKEHAPRDPEVQLALWKAAALSKLRHHGWDSSLPMPGITVNDHIWNFFIFFEHAEKKLVSYNFYPAILICPLLQSRSPLTDFLLDYDWTFADR